MRVNLVFETYPLFYQPYIVLLVDKLIANPSVEVQFTSFKPGNKLNLNTLYIPSYVKRKLIEKLWKISNPKYKGLTYPEILWLKEKVEIIHLQHSFLHTHVLNLLRIPKQKRPKVVITLRGADTYLKPYIMERWRMFYENYGEIVDAFITVSNHQKEYLTKWQVPTEKIYVIPISFGGQSKPLPKENEKGLLKIISAFRMTWEKNIEGNIRTVKHLVDKGYDVHYAIYGDGNDLSQVYYLIERYNLSEYVKCYGRISNENFKTILLDYDFYLQLSISESAGATVIEAQSKGVPCIVSNSDGLPEMIIHNKTGFAVPYYDTYKAANLIIDLASDTSKYKSFSKAAIEFVNATFSVEREMRLMLALYEKLLKE